MNVKLRPYRESDADKLALLANNFKIAKFLRNGFPHPYNIDHAKAAIKEFQSHEPTRIFAITVNNELVGSAGIHPMDDIFSMNSEIGYWIGEPYWGKGYMSQAILQITDIAFEKFEINRVFARVFGNNPASMRIVEKAGYILEAKFEKTLLKNGEILDEYIYAKRR